MSEETFIYTYTYGVTSAVPDAGPADSGSEASVTTTVANTKSAENIAEESVITSFVILPLQTSPFLQPKNCTTKIPGAIVCPGLSSGVTCTGVATANSDLTETVQASCFPSEYRNLLYDNDGNYRDITSLAYPGSECPISWTVACMTEIPDATQALCCPSGWGCATEPKSRLCQSFVQTRTSVIDELAGNVTEHSVFMAHTPAFPLQAAVEDGKLRGDGASLTSSASGETDIATLGSHGLEAGAILGIVVGFVFLLVIIAVVIFILRYKKKKKTDERVVEVEMGGMNKKGKKTDEHAERLSSANGSGPVVGNGGAMLSGALVPAAVEGQEEAATTRKGKGKATSQMVGFRSKSIG